MIRDKSVLAIIPARGGSKGIPKKNIYPVAGRPLIWWTIKEAKKSKYIDRLILSSEDNEIISIAKNYGCEVPFVRPRTLAEDETPGISPVLHALEMLAEHYDYVMLLQPTSPLRIVDDIDGCMEMCTNQNAATCVSMTRVSENPYWIYRMGEGKKILPILKRRKPLLRRQDSAEFYALNGAVYFGKVGYVKRYRTFLGTKTIGYLMPVSRSYDIDTPMDAWICDALLTSRSAGVSFLD